MYPIRGSSEFLFIPPESSTAVILVKDYGSFLPIESDQLGLACICVQPCQMLGGGLILSGSSRDRAGRPGILLRYVPRNVCLRKEPKA